MFWKLFSLPKIIYEKKTQTFVGRFIVCLFYLFQRLHFFHGTGKRLCNNIELYIVSNSVRTIHDNIHTTLETHLM